MRYESLWITLALVVIIVTIVAVRGWIRLSNEECAREERIRELLLQATKVLPGYDLASRSFEIYLSSGVQLAVGEGNLSENARTIAVDNCIVILRQAKLVRSEKSRMNLISLAVNGLLNAVPDSPYSKMSAEYILTLICDGAP